jgi:hypothetical protein
VPENSGRSRAILAPLSLAKTYIVLRGTQSDLIESKECPVKPSHDLKSPRRCAIQSKREAAAKLAQT